MPFSVPVFFTNPSLVHAKISPLIGVVVDPFFADCSRDLILFIRAAIRIGDLFWFMAGFFIARPGPFLYPAAGFLRGSGADQNPVFGSGDEAVGRGALH